MGYEVGVAFNHGECLVTIKEISICSGFRYSRAACASRLVPNMEYFVEAGHRKHLQNMVVETK